MAKKRFNKKQNKVLTGVLCGAVGLLALGGIGVLTEGFTEFNTNQLFGEADSSRVAISFEQTEKDGDVKLFAYFNHEDLEATYQLATNTTGLVIRLHSTSSIPPKTSRLRARISRAADILS